MTMTCKTNRLHGKNSVPGGQTHYHSEPQVTLAKTRVMTNNVLIRVDRLSLMEKREEDQFPNNRQQAQSNNR